MKILVYVLCAMMFSLIFFAPRVFILLLGAFGFFLGALVFFLVIVIFRLIWGYNPYGKETLDTNETNLL